MFLLILLAFCFVSISAEITKEHIQQRKKNIIQSIYNDPHKIANPSYQPQRVMATIHCPDCDDVPKVIGAGEIFRDPGIEYQLMHNGVKIIKDCYYGEHTSWMTDIIYALYGHHEPQEEKVFYEILKYVPDGGTMIELGSYWAYYSLWFAHAVPNARNYMIDTTSFYLSVGKQNFALNNKPGFFELGHIGYYPEHRSPQIFIDQYLEEKNINHVNILHADIQGAELEMLVSCEKSIQENKIDFFVVSTHPMNDNDPNALHYECLAFLVQRDFHIIAEHTPTQSCSADGLIVARRKEVNGPNHVFITK